MMGGWEVEMDTERKKERGDTVRLQCYERGRSVAKGGGIVFCSLNA